MSRPIVHARDHWRKHADAQATDWIEVGSAGAADYEGTWGGTVRYAFDSAGDAELDGDATGGTFGTTIFFLPSDYWPPIDQYDAGWLTSDDVLVQTKIAAADGAVSIIEVTGGGGAVAAADVTSTPAGNLAADDVQEALNELDSEKVPNSRTITAGAALTGGGDLSANRTLDVAVDNSTIEVSSDALRVKDGGITAAKVAADVATQAELDAHTGDTTDAHDATAISIVDGGGYYSGAEVEAALQEIGAAILAGGEVAAEYQDYTPTWTATGTAPAIGNSSVTARYVQIGKFVHATVKIVFGSTATFGTGDYRFAFPVDASPNTSIGSTIGNARLVDNSTGSEGHVVVLLLSGTTMLLSYGSTYMGPSAAAGQTSPWTWAQNDEISYSIVYEAAPAAEEMPSFVAAGSGASRSLTGNATPSYPAGLEDGDRLFLHIAIMTASGTIGSIPGDWTLHSGPEAFDSTGRMWIYTKPSDGTETGTIDVAPDSTQTLHARMYAFRGLPALSFIEGDDFSDGEGTTVSPPDVVTSGDNRLACAFVVIADDDETPGSFTGESGGDWTEAVAEYASSTGTDCTLQLQTAAMASAGTISGGSITLGGTTDWGVHGLALKPA